MQLYLYCYITDYIMLCLLSDLSRSGGPEGIAINNNSY